MMDFLIVQELYMAWLSAMFQGLQVNIPKEISITHRTTTKRQGLREVSVFWTKSYFNPHFTGSFINRFHIKLSEKQEAEYKLMEYMYGNE